MRRSHVESADDVDCRAPVPHPPSLQNSLRVRSVVAGGRQGALVGTASRSAREWVRHEAELMLSSASVAEERTVAA
eukprot:2268308-Prymnesium_polylepis.1